MKKPILLAGIAFLVSVAAGAAGRVVLTPAPAPLASSEVTEDAAMETPLVGHTSSPVPADLEPELRVEPPAPLHAGPPTAELRPSAPDASGVEFREMGRILSALTPKDASLFLGHLDDHQVLAILRAMSIAEADSILDRLPEERATRLKAHLFDMPKGKR